MENKNQLAVAQKMTPNFVQKSMESIESAMEYASILLKSKLVPNHFYEKGSDGKPDFTKGKPEAVVLVIQHGMELGLSATQSLQQVVPVNGLMSVKGDGAKSLILTSGLCDIWEEKESGSIEAGDYSVEIYSKRKDGKEKRDSFSLKDAIRADLFYSDAQLKTMAAASDWQQKKANAFKYGAWYKYPKRMTKYRILGFIARDLYPDVMQGMVTTEEAMDYPKEEGTVDILGADGKKIRMTESQNLSLIQKSESITKSVSSHIEKANGKLPEDEVQEVVPEVEQAEQSDEAWTEASLTEKGSGIYQFAEQVLPTAKYKLLESIPGKKSNKRFREALLAYQDGVFDKWLTDALKSNMGEAEPPQTQTADPEEKVAPEKKEEVISDDLPWENRGSQNQITTAEATKAFEAERATPPQQEGEENTEIPVVSELGANGKRSFPDAIKLTNFFKTTLGVTDANINDQIKGTGLQFPSLGNFCERAQKDIIEMVIQKNL